MGKGAALKLPVLPEPNLSAAAVAASRSQGCITCSADDKFARGLDDFEFNYLDFDLLEGNIFDDPYSEAHGCGQLFDIPFGAQPLQDATDYGRFNNKAFAFEASPFGSLAVDALFKTNLKATAAAESTLDSRTAVPAIPNCAGFPGSAATLPGSTHSLLQGGFRDLSPQGAPAPALGSLQPPVAATQFAAKTLPGQLEAHQPQQPLAPLAVLRPALTRRRVENRCEISTAFAAPPIDQVVLFCSQAPKRKAEDDAESGLSQSAGDGCSLSAADATLMDDAVADDLPAPNLSTQQEVEELLPTLPTQQETSDGCIVYILPTLWHSHHPPFSIHVSLGLSSMRAPSAEAPATYYGSLNPRIVTTGVSSRPCPGAPHRAAEVLQPLQTRASRKVKGHTSKAIDADFRDAHTPAAAHNDSDLMEVWLLQRSLGSTGAGEVINSHHLTSTQCKSATITGRDGPQWAKGKWAVDVLAKIAAPTGQTFWLKAVNRAVQECDG